MNSSTSNAEQAVSFDFLVKVIGDKLELQHDILQSLLVPYINNEVPVAIVTVIGQPKSRKTLLTNFIQTRIIRLVGKESKQFGTVVTPTSGFPRSLDDCPSKSVRDKLEGQEGVLIWTKPCLVRQEDGHSLTVFILDIWSENPTPSLYTKLVDFCITSSSMVILVEDCCASKESNRLQWDISKSSLVHLKGREFQSLQVLIHANWEEENFYTLGLEGGKIFMNASKNQFSKRLGRVIDNGQILRGYFKDVLYFLAPLKSKSTVQNDKIHRSDSDHLRGLLEFSCKVVGFDPFKIFPLGRNKTGLSTLSVDSLFQNMIVICNSIEAVTESTDPSTFKPNNIEIMMEVCEEESSTYTQTNVEAEEAAIENQYLLVDKTGMNNRKTQNETKNHQPGVAVSIDYVAVTSTQSCGVGIYFGPDIVRLGIYLNAQTNPKYLNFSPFVTFERNEIVFFNPRSSHSNNFDVYQTLVEEENFPRTVLISDKVYQLHTEEIVGVFLNKIKSEAETKFGFVIMSCSVAVSAFMSTSSKQMLKTALTLAGFERSTIMQSTTAVGLSYAVSNKLYRNGPAIFIHQAGAVFDVAITVISQTSISIRSISGLPYLEKSYGLIFSLWSKPDSQDTLRKKVKQLIRCTLASSGFSAVQLRALVMVHGNENFISDRSAITDALLGRPVMTLDETEGIVFGAAAFNASENKIPGAPNLEYNEVFPYTVIAADIYGKQISKIVKNNVPFTSKNMSTHFTFFDEVWDSRKVIISEFAIEKEKIFVGEYTINALNSKCTNFFMFVNFDYEGLIEVEAKKSFNSHTVPVLSSTRGLTMAQLCYAFENLRPILIPATAPCISSVPVKSQEMKTNTGAIGNKMTPPVVFVQDPKTKLVDSITEVTDRLAKSTTTDSIVVTRTNMLMKQFEELQVYLNSLSKENNSLLNESRNHQPEAAASADYRTVTSTQSFGVGIYFGPDIVRLGTYTNPQTNPNYLDFSPFVTFERNEIVFFNPRSSHSNNFDVYQTLVEEENFPRTVLISDKVYQLHTEEIVGVFLNKIKSEAETKFGFVIMSCSVAVSAFMSTSSKQMLKTALTLAGFERSTIIQSTTAVGLSFVVTSKVCPNGPAIFVHQAGSVFDVAIAVINQTSISIRRISGLPYLEKPSGHLSAFLDTTDIQDARSKKVKILINNTLASSDFTAWQLEALVLVQGEKHFLSDKSAITEPLLDRLLTTLDETEGIVLGAAALNAFQNKIPGAPNLEYNEVFPYTFIAEINGKQTAKIVRHNVPVTSKNMSTQLPVTDVRDFGEVRITEFAVEKEKVIVGEYTINAMNSRCRNFLLCVKFNSEGLIEVEAQTADLKTFPVQIRTQGLTAAEQSAAVENLRPILIPTASPCLPNVPLKSQEVKANAGAVENEMTSPVVVEPFSQNAMAKLVDLITDVNDRLAKSTATNPMIFDRISERIKQCEELLGKVDVKDKQIEMQIKLLDLAAAQIK